MSKSDENRCNCSKIFQKEVLNCNCDKVDCRCEDSDYKCCMKITPGGCHNGTTDSQCSNDECACGKTSCEDENQRSCSIKRESEDSDKCCCVENGRDECCCTKIQENSCCCIVSGKEECCCDHSYAMESEKEVGSKLIEKTSVKCESNSSLHSNTSIKRLNLPSMTKESDDKESVEYAKTISEPICEQTKKSLDLPPKSFSTINAKDPQQGKTCVCIGTCDSYCIRYSELIEEIPSDLEEPSIFTSTCMASTKDKSEFQKVDDELVNELKSLKNNSISQESYDVYIVNDEGRVNSFELKHFVNKNESYQEQESNPKEVLLNKQVHGICIKNKQSEMSSTYNGKMKTILDKIKEQKTNESLKPNEPTILEITEFSVSNKDKTTEIIKNVFGKDVSSCSCNGKSACLCECNVSKVKIIHCDDEQTKTKDTQNPIHLSDLKSYSTAADALNTEVNKMSNTTKNVVNEASESVVYDHQTNSCEEDESVNKLYYSIHSSSESELNTSIEDLNSPPQEKLLHSTQPLNSPFEKDMANKIEDLIIENNNQQEPLVETININVGGNALSNGELEVTEFKMSIHGDGIEEKIDIKESKDKDVFKNVVGNEAPTILDKIENDAKEKESSIMNSTKAELERLKSIEENQGDSTLVEEKLGFFGKKLGSVIKNIFEGSTTSSSPNESSFLSSSSASVKSSGKSTNKSEDSKASTSTVKSINISGSQVKNSSESTSQENLQSKTFVSYQDVVEDNKGKNKSNSRISKSAVSCLAKTRKTGNSIEIALHLTNSGNEEASDNSTITFVENDSDSSSCLMRVKRNNKVGKLIEYFEDLDRKK